MIRVLHLIDQRSAQTCGTTLGLLAESRGRLGHIDESVVVLGGSDLADTARRAQVGPMRVIGAPLGCGVLAWSALRRAAAELSAGERYDLIHCWSLGALSLAAMVFRTTPRIMTCTASVSQRSRSWLRALTTEAAGRTVLLPISATIRRDLLSAGIAEPSVHVLRPGLTMSRIDRNNRDAVRNSWGIEPDDNVIVIALLSDPPQRADAVDAAMIVAAAIEGGTLHGRDIRILVGPKQRHLQRARSLLRRRGQSQQIAIDQRIDTPWQVLPGCDVGMAIGPASGGLSLLWTMAANIPLLGEATYAVSEIIEDRHSALLTRPGHRPAAAHRLAQLLTDKQLAWKLRDTARHEAYSFFSRQRYCQSLKDVYEQIVESRDVAVPEMEPTGGLRFSGRA